MHVLTGRTAEKGYGMYIEDIASVYEEEKIKFNIDGEKQSISFMANTSVMQNVPFQARILNSSTVLFNTVMPIYVPEKFRDAVSRYLTLANYGLILGGFQLNMMNGELKYSVAGCHAEGEALADEVISRLTFVGFNMFNTYLPGVFSVIYGGKDPETAYGEVEAEIRFRQMKKEQNELEADGQ